MSRRQAPRLDKTIAGLSSTFETQAHAAASYARASTVLRPAPLRREAAKVQLTSASGTFTAAGASSVLVDTSDFAVGTSAAKFVTDGAATYSTYMWPALSPVWDMTNDEGVRIVCKIDSYTNVNFIILDVGTNGGVSTHRFTTALGEPGVTTALRVAREGEWLVLDFPKSVFTVGSGTPDWSQVTKFRIAAQDKDGAALTVRVNSAGRIAKQTALPNGAAIFTFDDSSLSHYTIAKAKLDSVGAPGVAYPIADQVGGSGLTMANLKAMRDISGWEIGTHAMSNADHAVNYVGQTEDQTRSRFDALKAWAATNGFNSDTHAWPSGMSDATSERVALQYVSSALGTLTGVQPSSMPNPMRIRRTDLGSGTSLATAQARIDGAKANGSLAIFMSHEIVPSGPTGLQVLQATLEGAIDYCIAQDVPILTMTDAMRRLRVI